MIWAFDTETHRFKAGLLAPPIVCASFAEGDHAWLVAGSDLHSAIGAALCSEHLLVLHNAPYDLCVIAAGFPDLVPHIFTALEAGRIHDTLIREKLLNLSTSGRLEFVPMPDGSAMRVTYSLAMLERLYGIDHGVDRLDQKSGDDSLRSNYAAVDGRPVEDWPEDFRTYPLLDAKGTLKVWERQNDRCSREAASLETQEMRVAAAFCLRLMSCWGFPVDLEERARVAAQVEAELTPEKIGLLAEAGILRAPKKKRDGTLKPPSRDMKVLRKLIEETCVTHGLEIKKTASGDVSTDKETLTRAAPFHPVLKQYQHRQYLQQLATTALPNLLAPRIYPNFDVLVETGRTSSYGGSDYPSTNIQNISSVRKVKHGEGVEEINVRHCLVPEPGHVLCSVDFASLEFVSMAQKCFALFGHSVMRELINAGTDPHAYLGANLASHLSPEHRGITFEEFKALKGTEVFAKYRKLAKPVGFGYPGGLGAKRFVEFARNDPYNIVVTVEEAELLKRIWFDTYPEAREFFRWIVSQCVDSRNTKGGETVYAYTSPLGLVRRGASYTSACNGALLQTPAAEGALLAVIAVSRACYDPSEGSILYGCRPHAFIHDDIITSIPEDNLMHARAFEQARLMIEAMRLVMPDVAVRAMPALQRRWDKEAETVLDGAGRLQIWSPPTESYRARSPVALGQ